MAFYQMTSFAGVAFRGLPDTRLFPAVSAVYGNTEISMVYLGPPLDGWEKKRSILAVWGTFVSCLHYCPTIIVSLCVYGKGFGVGVEDWQNHVHTKMDRGGGSGMAGFMYNGVCVCIHAWERDEYKREWCVIIQKLFLKIMLKCAHFRWGCMHSCMRMLCNAPAITLLHSCEQILASGLKKACTSKFFLMLCEYFASCVYIYMFLYV